jgi:hypothetical protein
VRRLLATLATLGLVATLATGAMAQGDEKGRNQDKNRSGTQKIRGMVSEVVAEGELAIDYRTNRAVVVQAAYLTIVGSPVSGRDDTKANAKDDRSSRQRDNIYVVWLTPRTKIYQASDGSGKSDRKKEAALEQLEVGDFVEVEGNVTEASAANAWANQTPQMRRKHGRDRVYSLDATAVTILPPKGDEKSSGKD